MLKRAWGWLCSGLGYSLYAVGVLGFLLWLLFPKEAMRRYLEGSLDRVCPDLRWQIVSMALEIPAGLTLHRLDAFAKNGDQNRLLHIDSITVQPYPIESIRSGKVQAGYRVEVGKGSAVGRVRMDGQSKRLYVEGTVHDLQLADQPLLNRQLGRTLQGAVSGNFSGHVVPANGDVVEFEARVQVKQGNLSLKRPILGHATLPFSQGEVLVHGGGKTFHLEKGVVNSELFDGQFSGRITLHRDPSSSQLEMQGNIQPKNNFFSGLENTVALQAFRMRLKDSALPFRVSGDLSNPGIHFEGFTMLLQAVEKELR